MALPTHLYHLHEEKDRTKKDLIKGRGGNIHSTTELLILTKEGWRGGLSHVSRRPRDLGG